MVDSKLPAVAGDPCVVTRLRGRGLDPVLAIASAKLDTLGDAGACRGAGDVLMDADGS